MLPESDRELLEHYLDGTLPPSDVAIIQSRLRTDAGFAEELIRLAREEAILTEWARAAAVLHSSDSAAAASATIPFPTRSSAWRKVRVGMAAAAVLLAMLLLYRPRQVDVQALAQLEDVQGDVFVVTEIGDTLEAQTGQKLFAGQEVRTSGEKSSVTVKYADSTLLELAGDTHVHLSMGTGGKKVDVRAGAGDISGVPDGKELMLSTPHVEVLARSGKFSFASQPEGGTRVESEKGRIRMTRKSDGKSVTVDSGQYAVATRQADPMRPIPVPLSPLTLHESTGPIRSLIFTADGQSLVGGGGKGPLMKWGVQSGQVEPTPEKHGKRVTAMALSPDGRTLAIAGEDRSIFLWELPTGTERQIGKSLKSKVLALAFAPDGQALVAGCDDRMVRFLDLISGEEQIVLKGHKTRINALAFSPDGRLLATAGGQDKLSGEIHIWDARRKEEVAALAGHDREVLALAFSPDGRLLATAGRDSALRLWETAAFESAGTFRSNAGPISSVAFAPDGKTLATGSCDGLVKLWDVATGAERLSFKGHKNCVNAVAFSPDGKLLATGGTDRTIKLWDLTKPTRSDRVSFRDHSCVRPQARCLGLLA